MSSPSTTPLSLECLLQDARAFCEAWPGYGGKELANKIRAYQEQSAQITANQGGLDDDTRLGWALWRIRDLEQQLAARAAYQPQPSSEAEGPECEDGPDEEGFSGPRPWNSFASGQPSVEPETHEAKCPALNGGNCNCPTSPVSVDNAWSRFCGAIGRGPDAPLPGMIEAFEAHYAQSFTDRDWRSESGVWAAAWSAARAHTPPQPQQPVKQPVAWWKQYPDGNVSVVEGKMFLTEDALYRGWRPLDFVDAAHHPVKQEQS